jgi:hypothetical protein
LFSATEERAKNDTSLSVVWILKLIYDICLPRFYFKSNHEGYGKVAEWLFYEQTFNKFLWKNLLCKVNSLFWKVIFFPAKISFSKMQKKNLLCKGMRSNFSYKKKWKDKSL